MSADRISANGVGFSDSRGTIWMLFGVGDSLRKDTHDTDHICLPPC